MRVCPGAFSLESPASHQPLAHGRYTCLSVCNHCSSSASCFFLVLLWYHLHPIELSFLLFLLVFWLQSFTAFEKSAQFYFSLESFIFSVIFVEHELFFQDMYVVRWGYVLFYFSFYRGGNRSLEACDLLMFVQLVRGKAGFHSSSYIILWGQIMQGLMCHFWHLKSLLSLSNKPTFLYMICEAGLGTLHFAFPRLFCQLLYR